MKHVFLTLLFLGALFTVSMDAQTCKPAACTTKDGKPACIVDGKNGKEVVACTPEQVAACKATSPACAADDKALVLAALGATSTPGCQPAGAVNVASTTPGCQPAGATNVATTTPACQDHKASKKSTRQLASNTRSN